MSTFILRLSLVTFSVFMALEVMRPGFVSYQFSPLWLLLPGALAFVWTLFKRGNEIISARFIFIDRLLVLGSVVLAVLASSEELESVAPLIIIVVLSVFLLPSLVESNE